MSSLINIFALISAICSFQIALPRYFLYTFHFLTLYLTLLNFRLLFLNIFHFHTLFLGFFTSALYFSSLFTRALYYCYFFKFWYLVLYIFDFRTFNFTLFASTFCTLHFSLLQLLFGFSCGHFFLFSFALRFYSVHSSLVFTFALYSYYMYVHFCIVLCTLFTVVLCYFSFSVSNFVVFSFCLIFVFDSLLLKLDSLLNYYLFLKYDENYNLTGILLKTSPTSPSEFRQFQD